MKCCQPPHRHSLVEISAVKVLEQQFYEGSL